MGLRMAWETENSQILKFAALEIVTQPRTRFWTAGKQSKRTAAPLDTGLEARAGSPDLGRGDTAGIFGKNFLDRARKDFLCGLRGIAENAPENAAGYFRQAAEREDKLADAWFSLAICTQNAQEQLMAADRALVQKAHFTKLFKEAGVNLSGILYACDGKRLRVMSDLPGLEIMTAEIYQSHQKYEDALRLLERSQFCELEIFRFSRGELLFRLQRYEAAIDLLKRLSNNPLLAGPAQYLLGLSLERLGYYSTAVQVYRGCLRREAISKQLEASMRRRMIVLLERDEKHYLAQRERERLAALEEDLRI